MVDPVTVPKRSAAVAALTHTPADELANHRAELQTAALHAALGPGEIQGILNSRPDLPRPLVPARWQVRDESAPR